MRIMKNFLVVDDHSVVRQGMSLIIKKNIDFSVVHTASSIGEALNVLKQEQIDFIILDINLQDSKGVNTIEAIKSINKSAKILMFSALDEEIYALRYINIGADGYLSKMTSEDDTAAAIFNFVEKGKYFSEDVKNKIFENFISKKKANPIESLSDREIEIAKLLIKGYGNLEISRELNLQKSTISTYKNRIFEKLEVENLAKLIELFRLYEN